MPCNVPNCNCNGLVHPVRPELSITDEWEVKCWGKVRHLFDHPGAAISHLMTIKGHRCSCHFHKYRSNLFHVISGEIEIVHFVPVSGDDCGEHAVRQVKVGTDQQYVVPARHAHWFRVLASGEVIELYWRGTEVGDVTISDIVRYDSGGEDNSDWLIEHREWIKAWHRQKLRETK